MSRVGVSATGADDDDEEEEEDDDGDGDDGDDGDDDDDDGDDGDDDDDDEEDDDGDGDDDDDDGRRWPTSSITAGANTVGGRSPWLALTTPPSFPSPQHHPTTIARAPRAPIMHLVHVLLEVCWWRQVQTARRTFPPRWTFALGSILLLGEGREAGWVRVSVGACKCGCV